MSPARHFARGVCDQISSEIARFEIAFSPLSFAPPRNFPLHNAESMPEGSAAPTSFIPLLKVTLTWRNSYKSNNVLHFFNTSVTPSTIHKILATPGSTAITIYEGSAPKDLSPSLWLAAPQANLVKAAMVQQCPTINPSLINNPWKSDFVRRLDQFGNAPPTPVTFSNGQAVDVRLAELKELATEKGLESSRKELEDCRLIWEVINEGRKAGASAGGVANGAGAGGGSFFAMDIETWERDHDFLTEIGYSYVIFRANGGGRPGTNQTREDTHVGAFLVSPSFRQRKTDV